MAENLLITATYAVTILVMEYIGDKKLPHEVITDIPFWAGFVMLMFILWSKK